MTLTYLPNIVATPGDETSHNRSDRQLGRSDRQSRKPSGIFNRIDLLTGGSKNYETKCSRITLPSYTLYFWPRANLTKTHMAGLTANYGPVRPPADISEKPNCLGRSDRHHGRSDRSLPDSTRTFPKTRVFANQQRHCQLTHHSKIMRISP